MGERLGVPRVDLERVGPSGSEERARKVEADLSAGKRETLALIRRYLTGLSHTHTDLSSREGLGYTESTYTLEEWMAYAEKLGLGFVCFNDHSTPSPRPQIQAHGSDLCRSLENQIAQIEGMNRSKNGEGCVAFSGVEANIVFDGDQPAIDLPQATLGKLDLVIASRHMIDRERDLGSIRESLLFAIEHPDVDVIGHPDRNTWDKKRQGEETYQREYYAMWQEVVTAMVRNGKAFEINLNAAPDPRIVRMAAEAGVSFSIGYDAHEFTQYRRDEFEVQAWEKALQSEESQEEVVRRHYQESLEEALEHVRIRDVGEGARNRWGKEEDVSDEDLRQLQQYKEMRLTDGPGVVTFLRLARWVKRLEDWGVGPERVVNSSRQRLIGFLKNERDKRTPNLEYLASLPTQEVGS